MEEALLWCEGLLPIVKLGIYTRWRANWIRPTITAHCSITESHLEHGLWLKDLYSCKIMTQSILVNSARGTLKAKEEPHIPQLVSWLTQSVDLNPIELVWDELDWKVRAEQPTSVAHLWKFLQESWAELSSVYFQSLVERMPRICEVVIVAKGGHFD